MYNAFRFIWNVFVSIVTVYVKGLVYFATDPRCKSLERLQTLNQFWPVQSLTEALSDKCPCPNQTNTETA